jgi:hypothetical protein
MSSKISISRRGCEQHSPLPAPGILASLQAVVYIGAIKERAAWLPRTDSNNHDKRSGNDKS